MYNSMDEVPVSLHASIDTGDGEFNMNTLISNNAHILFIVLDSLRSYCQIWCMTIRQRSCPIDYPPVFHLETEHCPRPASVDRIPLFASSVSERIGAV